MRYYVRMKIDNHIIERYGFEAWIHATIQDGKEVFYAKLFMKDSDECGECEDDKFPTFSQAHDFLVESVKTRLTPRIDNVRLKGKWAAEDLETIEKSFEL